MHNVLQSTTDLGLFFIERLFVKSVCLMLEFLDSLLSIMIPRNVFIAYFLFVCHQCLLDFQYLFIYLFLLC